MRTIDAFGRQLDADRQYYIEETEKACDSECIWRLVLNSYVYLNKYIKSLSFFKKTLAFLYFMVYTREACDIDSYEA